MCRCWPVSQHPRRHSVGRILCGRSSRTACRVLHARVCGRNVGSSLSLSALSSQQANVHKARCSHRITQFILKGVPCRSGQPSLQSSLCPCRHHFRPVPCPPSPLEACRLPKAIPAELHPGPVFLRPLSRAPMSAGHFMVPSCSCPQPLPFLLVASPRLSFPIYK